MNESKVRRQVSGGDAVGRDVTRRQWDTLHVAVSSAPLNAVGLQSPDTVGHYCRGT